MKKLRSFVPKLIFLLSAALLLWVVLFWQDNANTGSVVTDSAFIISHESGFYRHSLRIRITPVQKAVIYYTTDGSEPSSTSSSSFLYERPIFLKASLEEKSCSLRFRLYFDDGTSSKVYTYSYILGYFIHERYHTYVVNITGDPDDLFGYENGIFVGGKLRDDFLAEHPNVKDPADYPSQYGFPSSATEVKAKDPANYNIRGRESERPVSFQIFDDQGNLLTSQDCGLRIFGNASRSKMQKSFQLFARKEYDTYGNFHLSLFPELHRETDGTILDRYNRLVFRNSGNDFAKAFIRDTLIQQLATDYGFPFSTPYVPSTVYINGEYAGFYWVKVPFSSGQMDEFYHVTDGHFERVTIQEFYKKAGEDEEAANWIINDYQTVYDAYVDAELSDDAVYKRLCRQIDVENYLAYYALEIYIGNKDWPYNNVRAWRYIADDGNYTENSVFDGRYRYLLYDTDYSFGLVSDVPSYSCEEDNIAVLLNNYQSPIFCNLMERADCREMFTNYVCDLMNDSFSPESVYLAAQKLISERDAELPRYVETLPPDVATMDTVNSETADILLFAQNRPGYMHTFLQKDYALFYPYFLHIESPEDTKVRVNSIEDAGSEFTGIYYADNSLTLKASVNEGHRFVYWLVNGTQYREAELTLSSEELKTLLSIPIQEEEEFTAPEGFGTLGYAESEANPTLDIRLVEEDNPDASFTVSRIHAKGTNDFVEISNPSGHELSLIGLYLSDDAANLKKTKIPDCVLAPGESLTLYGKKNRQTPALSALRLDFSLRKYETLYLSDESGTILEEIPIPDMGREDSDYVRDPFSGKFHERTAD